MAEIKCLNYFTYQFLVEKDFKDEQTYHRDMRRRHNRVFHSWGVAEGLVVTQTGDKEVSISPGTAIDKDGREIVLPSEPSPPPIDLTVFGTDVDVFLTIVYQEVFDEADRYTSGGVDDYTRTTERPKLEGTTNVPPGDGSVIALAKVHLDDTGNVAEIDKSVRTPVGSKVAPESVGPDELSSGAVTELKMANNAVSNRTIEDNAINTSKIADNAITAAKIRDGNVGNTELANGAVNEPKLATNAVSSRTLANNAVTMDKIANNSVNGAKIVNGSIGNVELANGAVNEPKLATNAVSSRTLANNAVTMDKIANNAVINSKIVNNAVTAAKIADGSVGTRELADNTVSITKMKKRLVWDSTATIAANGTRGYNVLAVPLSSPRGGSFLIHAYSTTNGARFEWKEVSSTGGPLPYWINQTVYFTNLSNISIEVKFKIYEVLEN